MVLTVSGLAAVLIGLPVLPLSAENVLRAVNPQVTETYGWPEFVTQVTRAAAPLPPDVPIFVSNYGEAGALTILAPPGGLGRPVVSAHNNYMLWGPPPGTPDTALCVGEWNAAYLRRFWSQVDHQRQLARLVGIVDQARHRAHRVARPVLVLEPAAAAGEPFVDRRVERQLGVDGLPEHDLIGLVQILARGNGLRFGARGNEQLR